MKCPVCGKEASAHIYHCAACGVYVHEQCWKKHMDKDHKEKKN